MKLTTEQAKALLEAEPFAVIYVYAEEMTCEDDKPYVETKSTHVAATNINSEQCYWGQRTDLLPCLDTVVRDSIDGIQAGASVYLCQMKFVDSEMYPLYSHDDFLGVGESDPYWEIVSYELLSHETFEVPVMEES